MKNWEAFWQNYRIVPVSNPADLLYQIGKTVHGRPYDEETFTALTDDIQQALKLEPKDRLLDLCCGNGVLTRALAPRMKSIIGVDFSQPFIENARQHSARENVSYILHDVGKLDECGESLRGAFDKVLLYDALAYFNPSSLSHLLRVLNNLAGGPVVCLLGAVLWAPDRNRFLSTWRYRWNYWFNVRILGRTQGIGRWWRPADFARLKEQMNGALTFEIRQQSHLLPTSTYRRDVLLKLS